MDKIKILVACHKKADVYSNDVYLPIHVGKALSSEDLGFIGDNTGDNISIKNRQYCELTAQYWAWKNLDCEYVGLCHYRRYLASEFSQDNVELLMNGADIVLAKSIYFDKSLLAWHKEALTEEDVYIFYNLFKKVYPQFSLDLDKVYLQGNKLNPGNIFLCKKTLFDEFAKWQFDFFFELEKVLRPSGYSRLNRIVGYFGEVMFDIYVSIRNLKVLEMPLVSMMGKNEHVLDMGWKERIIKNFRFKRFNCSNKWSEAVVTGMKADGIYDHIK